MNDFSNNELKVSAFSYRLRHVSMKFKEYKA